MSIPFAVRRRASSVGDLQATFAVIDARRMEYLAAILAECGRAGAAELAASWALEHRLTADRLSGAVAVGAGEDDAAVTASAIAFGGPLPARVA